VNKRGSAFTVYIAVNGISEHLGTFRDELEAARAYDRRAVTLPNRPLNFRKCDGLICD
jgi:hypothetical protein